MRTKQTQTERKSKVQNPERSTRHSLQHSPTPLPNQPTPSIHRPSSRLRTLPLPPQPQPLPLILQRHSRLIRLTQLPSLIMAHNLQIHQRNHVLRRPRQQLPKLLRLQQPPHIRTRSVQQNPPQPGLTSRLVTCILVDGAHAGNLGRDVCDDEDGAVDSAKLVAGEGQQGLDVVLVCDGVDLHEESWEVGGGDV